MRVIVPGSYDPVTLGHLDIIRRAAEQYEEVYAVIFQNAEKTYTFSLDDRVRMLLLATDELPNVIVSFSNGYVIDYVHEHEIDHIVKGIRSEKDLAYEQIQEEWNLAHGGVTTEFLRADPTLETVSSTRVREALLRGESIRNLVPARVEAYLKRLAEGKQP